METSPTGSEAELAPIRALLHALDAEFGRDPDAPRAAAILAEYASRHDDWRCHAHFAPNCYTRNLVGRTEWYELLVLCWDAGQASPIHDHAGQNCWMAILEGEIVEEHYEWPAEGYVGPLHARSERVFERGRVAFINDGIALHRVKPSAGLRGVSLHLYSRPIETCHAYDEATGRVLPRQLTYHTA